MTFTLKAATRKESNRGSLNVLRSSFKIPAVVYGHGRTNQSLSISYRDFDALFSKAGTSSVVNLLIDEAKTPIQVLVSEIQRNPVTDKVTHVDLHQIRMDEKIKTEINIEYVGESPAVKNLGGNLIINKDKLNVECLPADLVSTITVDISKLANLDDSIHIRDLAIPKSITVLDDADDSVVSVLKPREEVVEEVTTTLVEPEVIGKDKAEEGEEEAEKAPAGKSASGDDKEKKAS